MYLGVPTAILVLAGMTALYAQTTRPADRSTSHAATQEKIIHDVSERFSFPETVKITVSPFRHSGYEDFYETTLTLDDGK